MSQTTLTQEEALMKTRKELFECDACNCHGFTLSAMRAHNKTAEHIKLTYDKMYVPKPPHTPGPWHVGGVKLKNNGHGIGNGRAAIARALVTGCVTYEKSYANARLIAAAPEMLQALHRAMAHLRGHEDGQFIAQVIAKAEGR
jgi:hypothetical protein